MRKMFLTTYRVPSKVIVDDVPFSAYLLADDIDDAKRIVQLRGLGEEIVGESESLHTVHSTPLKKYGVLLVMPEEYRKPHASVLLHQVLFLLHLAEKSNRYHAVELFSDLGLVHQLYHLTSIPTIINDDWQHVVDALDELTLAAPEMFLNADELAIIARNKVISEKAETFTPARVILVNGHYSAFDNALWDLLVKKGKIKPDPDFTGGDPSWLVQVGEFFVVAKSGDIVTVDANENIVIR